MGVLKQKEMDDEGGFSVAELSQILEAHSESFRTYIHTHTYTRTCTYTGTHAYIHTQNKI